PNEIPTSAIDLPGVSANFLRRHRVLPLGWSDENLLAGVIDPERSDGLAALSFAAGCAAEPRLMALSDQKRLFDTLYGESADAIVEERETSAASAWVSDAVSMRDHAEAGPAVRLVDAILERAIEENASDIHIEPLPDRVRVRLRVNGALATIREEQAPL